MLIWVRWSVSEVCSYFDLDVDNYKKLCSKLFTEDEIDDFIRSDIRKTYCLYIAGIRGKKKYFRTKVVEPEVIVRFSKHLRIPIPLDVLAAYEGKAKIVS